MKKSNEDRSQNVRATSSHVTRRAFLCSSALGALGAASAPMILPRHVLGMNGQPGANDRIVLGMIGVGRRGRNLLRSAESRDDVVVAMTADAYLDRGDTQDYRELLDRADIDGVIIASQDHWHAIMAIHAALAGKHVYTEKPLSWTIHEGRQMVCATRRHHVAHQTGSQQRSLFDNYRACMLVRNGVLGRILRVEVANYPSPMEHALSGAGEIPEGLDWDRWCGPGPLVPFHPDVFSPRANPGWMSFRQFSTGEMGGWGTHGLDQIQWALGMDESGPVEIWTEGDTFEPWVVNKAFIERTGEGGSTHNRGGPSSPRVSMLFQHPDGDVVLEFKDGQQIPWGGGVLYGENGTMTIGRSSLRTDPPELAAVRPAELEAMPVQLIRSANHMGKDRKSVV